MTTQFAGNLKLLKEAIKKWLPIWIAQRQRNLRETEDRLAETLDDGPLSSNMLEELKFLESQRTSWINSEEQWWRLKSKALWINTSDNNTKFFFANYKKYFNTIWDLTGNNGNKANSFKEKVELKVH